MMLTTRTIILSMTRKFSDSSSLFTANTLCNEENRVKCIEKMKVASKMTTVKLHPSVKIASVLIPIIRCGEQNNELALLYTLRSNKMRKHISQVSFPGGMMEKGDASAVDCALRETEEEIGIGRDKIDVWGHSNFVHLRNAPAIMPVIGEIRDYSDDLLRINEDEVEQVFTVPISELCRQRRHTQFRMIPGSRSHNSAYSLPVYTTIERRIWGISAILTHLFLQSLLPPYLYDKRIPYISKYK